MKKLARHMVLLSAASSLAACAGLPGNESALQQGQAPGDSLPVSAAPVQADALGPYQRGKQSLDRGDIGKAIEYFLTAHRRDPESLEGINALAVSYDMLGRSDLADRYFAKALALAPRDPEILNNVGYAMLKRGDTQRARKYLLEAKALSSENEVILSNIAVLSAPTDIQEEQGQMARAQTRFSIEEGPALAPVPVPEVAEIPLTAMASSAPKNMPEAPEAPEAPTLIAAAPPPGQRSRSVGSQPLAASEPLESPLLKEVTAPPPEESISWFGERMEPLQVAEAPKVEAAVEAEEPAWTAGTAPAAAPSEPALSQPQEPTLLWHDENSAPMVVQTAEMVPSISLARKSSLLETQTEAPARAQHPHEADLIASLPASAASAQDAPAAAGEEVKGLPLTGSANHEAPVPPRAASLPCDLDDVKVTLVNGNGREGMAARTRTQLQMVGLPGKARLQNAERYNYMTSTIRYRGDLACQAEALAALLLGKPTLQQDEGISEDLRVLLGGDLLDFDARYVQNKIK